MQIIVDIFFIACGIALAVSMISILFTKINKKGVHPYDNIFFGKTKKD